MRVADDPRVRGKRFEDSVKLDNGDIVLALVDGSLPVLRNYHKAANQITLEASGKTKPISSKDIQILGKAVAGIRKF